MLVVVQSSRHDGCLRQVNNEFQHYKMAASLYCTDSWVIGIEIYLSFGALHTVSSAVYEVSNQ